MKTLGSVLTQHSQQLRNNTQLTTIIETVNSAVNDFRNLGGKDLSITVYENEPVVYLGDIYG